MIQGMIFVTLLGLSGCAFIKEATTYRAADPNETPSPYNQARQDPCEGQSDYWGCQRYYQEQDNMRRQNAARVLQNFSQSMMQQSQQPIYRQPTNTNCTPTYGGGLNCTTY